MSAHDGFVGETDLLRGYRPDRLTAYTNDEEDAVGLRVKAPFTVEDELVKLGVDFVRGEVWKPFTVVDRNLYTGQNPASAAPLAEKILEAL
ncbi:MAG: hypothetical protein WBR28_22405 [Mycobacterium sp.]